MRRINLKCLTEAEKNVVILRYGLNDNQPRTLLEVSSVLGITRERARQLENKAIIKLRNSSI